MKIFITGGTGYIGSAVVRNLLHHGHEVTVLARASSDFEALENMGASILKGELAGLPALRSQIQTHDAFVHAAMSEGDAAVANDRTAVETLGSLSRGFFLYTSGVWVLGNTGSSVATEASPLDPIPLVAWRQRHEELVLASAGDDLRTAVIRPGCVYGGRQSLLAAWFTAIEKGDPVSLAGTGANRWALIELSDLAECYRLILEKSEPGIFHATDDSDHTLTEMAEATIAAGRNRVSVEHVPLDTARQKYGAFADALTIDQRVSSAETRTRLDWSLSVPAYVGNVGRQWSQWRRR